MKLLYFIFLTINTVTSWVEVLRNHSVYQVTAFNYHDRQYLYNMHVEDDTIFFLNGVTNDAALPMIIVVDDSCTLHFEMNLQERSIEYLKVDDDQLNRENSTTNLNLFQNLPETSTVSKFLDWNSILNLVEKNCRKYAILEKIPIGTTFEDREIFVLKVSTGGQKPAVVIMGGEQGRDWMPTAIILNYIISLLENSSNSIMLKTFDYYFVPVFNPDGYAYSMSRDLFWIKNRKKIYPTRDCGLGVEAFGVTVERNWFLARSSTVPDAECDSVFLGHRYLSEEETKALANFLNNIAVNLISFINLRGFGNIVTIPYADSEKFANNQAILLEMLLFACKRVKQEFNITFKFSNTASCFFNFTGNSADWVKARLNVPIVYTIYMKQEPYHLPQANHIGQLTQQFAFITHEILMLGSSFYGPLFNKQSLIHSNVIFIVSIIVFIQIIKPI